jgi:hypothetical protein
MALEAEALEMEGFDEGEAADFAEAAPRRPSLRSSYVPRSFGQQPPVSQTQLQSALGRVDGNLKKVADVEASISSKVSALSAATKKETAERKKSLDSQVKDLNQKLQLLALLPLLVQAPSQTLITPLPVQGGGTVTTVSTPDTSKLDAILPLLLVSGLGSSTGGSGGLGFGGDGGSDSSMLLLALVLAFSGGK